MRKSESKIYKIKINPNYLFFKNKWEGPTIDLPSQLSPTPSATRTLILI